MNRVMRTVLLNIHLFFQCSLEPFKTLNVFNQFQRRFSKLHEKSVVKISI